MKKIIVYSILATFMLFAASCRKSDMPKIPEGLQRVPLPLVTFDPAGSQSISVNSPAAAAAFSQHITVDVFWKNDVPPKSMDLVVRKNGDNTTVKVIQAGITTYPTTVAVTGSQLISLFGTITLGDTYDFGVNITTQAGTVFEAFPAIGKGYGSGVAGEYGGDLTLNGGKGAQVSVQFGAICAYDPAIYQGNFVVVSDDFQDLNPGDVVVLTKVSNNSFTFTYPDPGISPFPPPPITVVVNTGNNNITIAKQQLGTKIYGVYDNPSVAATTGNVAPCKQTATLNLVWTVTQGSFGTNPLVIIKQ